MYTYNCVFETIHGSLILFSQYQDQYYVLHTQLVEKQTNANTVSLS